MSQKYNLDLISDMAEESGYEVQENFYDSRHYYVNSLWKPINKI